MGIIAFVDSPSEPNQPASQALPAGTRLEEFEIERVLGSGGFGITYLAQDIRLGRQVVIKENLPTDFCFRDQHSLTIAPHHTHGDEADGFAWSLENFSKEAAMLASLDHSGIVRVLRSFEALGTAYFVMPFVDGIPLDKLVKQRSGKPFAEGELRGLLERVLEALSYLHDRGIYHRDIKPANILITQEGIPVLIDFGSARQKLSERSMTVVESAGYTPFEQLQTRGNVGPWSDLYSVAATLARMLIGEKPPKANDRAFDDPWTRLAARPELTERYSTAFLETVDRAFALRPENRWRDAQEWMAELSREDAYEPDLPPQQSEPKITRDRASNVIPAQFASSVASLIPGTERDFLITKDSMMRFCWIPPGEFLMGSPEGEIGRNNDETPRPVTISRGFWLAKYPCTQKQWFEVMGDRPSHFGKPGLLKWIFPGVYESTEWHDLPVESVSWFDICGIEKWSGGFLGRVNQLARDGWRFDLPTKAQWEYACRAGTTSALNHGKELTRAPGHCSNLDEVAWYAGNSGEKTHIVGAKLANAWGLHDMHGNVWEWCLDWQTKIFEELAAVDPRGDDSGKYRVYKGGSWCENATRCRSTSRIRNYPEIRCSDLGFRLALVSSDIHL